MLSFTSVTRGFAHALVLVLLCASHLVDGTRAKWSDHSNLQTESMDALLAADSATPSASSYRAAVVQLSPFVSKTTLLPNIERFEAFAQKVRVLSYVCMCVCVCVCVCVCKCVCQCTVVSAIRSAT